MSAYYNEIDPFCCQWLKNLIAKNLIAPGEVDERDIRDVKPDDLRGFKQCHFFYGNAIVPQVAAAFISAAMEAIP